MRLWTYHSPAFSLVDGKYDPEKSKYYHDYRNAYETLWDLVGTRELIWCCVSGDDWPRKQGYCEWVLEVPETSFLKIVDSMVWNGILGNNVEPSGRLRDYLLAVAMREDHDHLYECYDAKLQRMSNPPGDPWASLFLENANDFRANVLLKHPLEQQVQIVSNELC